MRRWLLATTERDSNKIAKPNVPLDIRDVFAADVLQRLSLITLGRYSAFSLDDIASMLNAGGEPAIDRKRLAEKADELDRTIKQLSDIRDGLRRAASCPATRHIECEHFQKLLSAAEMGSQKRKTGNDCRRSKGV